jgi:D-3-phosphoglycerate dehydrogenase
VVTVLLTHNSEDREQYFGRALPKLQAISRVLLNPLDRDLTEGALIEAAAGCDIVVAHRSTPAPAELFERSPSLLAFLRCAVDISTIDLAAADASGVLVARADTSYVPSTAELALALLLDLARNVTDSTLDYRTGAPERQRPGIQLRGRTAGIIGYGAIGSYLAPVFHSLGMHVLVADPVADARVDGFEQCSLDELLGRSDVVLPLAASTPDTHHLIDATALAATRRGALLVNVSRGELLDEVAVADALDSGQLGGLAMDVGGGPDQRPSPLLASRPGVVATPHLGGLTPENADAQAMSAVEQVAAIVRGEIPPRTVNETHAHRVREWWTTRAAEEQQ